jgi:ankyrin repeat protein
MPTDIDQLRNAFCRDDAQTVRKLFAEHPELRVRINDPIGPFDSPILISAKSREMLDALLDSGADINARSRWWAGGFGLLDGAPPDLANYAIERGATVDIHAASRLGMLDRVKDLASKNPRLVHARGGDGQTPLHFASTLPIAEYLLDQSADINAKDIDHESTPAQYMIDERQEIARFLLRRGARSDILMAAALGDETLVKQHLDSDPNSIRMRVDEEWFPKQNLHSGGPIYQWKLGWHVSPHQVARQFHHEAILNLLMDRSPAEVKLVNACWLGDEHLVKKILQDTPDVRQALSQSDHKQLAHAARNSQTQAVRLMLLAGFSPEARGQHGATPLHWAAWHGNAEAIQLLLEKNPPLEILPEEHSATPLQWACHGSENSWHPERGNYPKTIELLLRAGAKPPAEVGATEEVKAVFRKLGFNA